MTTDAATAGGRPAPGLWARLRDGRTLPILTVLGCLLIAWYVGAIFMNADIVRDTFKRQGKTYTTAELVDATWSMERPILPAPHQIAVEINETVFQKKITSKRSLVYHTWITASATLLGFVFGTVLGVLIAVCIVHVRTLDRSLMPWVITSQTIPILAIAPMIIVVLASVNLVGLIPKSIISMYLCFFPVTIGMVKGLRSPDVMQRDLMRTYSASQMQVFWKLRLPASVPFLFTSLKVAIAISLVGAIVGELPTGAVAGIGARLLAGSYYGQTIQIWSALVVASLLGMVLVFAVSAIERLVLSQMGAQR
ncbi:ABC transporter permease [Oceanibacterium hippocampi]|uniref:Bicarbonate transport system permease protein CmpB n=1 Tax=Oceanibacterium hippocampi TaxID=745714 RepID=A0A1Y5T765_9PROT|nr:ABC transporter permease [Oceanibacterium hippocampi]SLN57432.1 Bicarbonate transport system permease protein CmpB [Oceanibacterium hippocampi]